MPNYICENCGASFNCDTKTFDELPACPKCGGKHRPCFFDKERVCPIPRRMMSGDYCCACTNIDIIKGQKEMLDLNKEAFELHKQVTKAEIPGLNKTPEKGSNKDVGGE